MSWRAPPTLLETLLLAVADTSASASGRTLPDPRRDSVWCLKAQTLDPKSSVPDGRWTVPLTLLYR